MMLEAVTQVLLIDDDELDAELAQRALSKAASQFCVTHKTSLTDGLQTLQQGCFDVVLLDLGLPEGRGLETLHAFMNGAPPVPLVVLTGLSDHEAAMEALDEGAQEFLCKCDVNTRSLSQTIRHAVVRWRLREDLRAANQLLEQKNQKLEELYSTAQQFVDNVSHEFRTPLTVIREFAAIMRDGLDGPVNQKQASRLDRVINRTDDLAIMVDDMLDTSKLEAGLLGVWRRRCCLSDVLAPVASLLERRAMLGGVTLQLDFDPAAPPVFCDDEKVRRAVINLAVNAIKFTGKQGRVSIWTRFEPEQNEVRVGVSDTGVGISQENLDRIFDRFQQVDTPLRSSTKGFGLGLNIARELVMLNLGQMHVESEQGRGSVFSFTTPADDPRSLARRQVEVFQKRCASEQDVSLLTVSIQPGFEESAVVVDEFLQGTRSRFNFVYRQPLGAWAMLTACPRDRLEATQSRIQEEWSQMRRNSPMPLPEITVKVLQTWSLQEAAAPVVEAFMQQFATAPATAAGVAFRPRVLLADDNPDVLEGLSVRLEAAGYDVITAENGLEAWAHAIAEQPDAIVLDVRMPFQDGLQTLKKLRGNESTVWTPIVMLSASLRDQQTALNEGANFFITNPYNSQDVLLALKNSLTQEPCPC
ncbi:response regulator [Lignipirellula cremea]|uniref:histidine kinase n=1 Tax=Lignipirellula cremea TaxID=2528010 RepID=A0A518DQ76_9BACT|nr:response regulator [Lignipirellula cremea]QDU93978.1 Non-motile and phage-resistance protein [Lignipirellula cremea]